MVEAVAHHSDESNACDADHRADHPVRHPTAAPLAGSRVGDRDGEHAVLVADLQECHPKSKILRRAPQYISEEKLLVYTLKFCNTK